MLELPLREFFGGLGPVRHTPYHRESQAAGLLVPGKTNDVRTRDPKRF